MLRSNVPTRVLGVIPARYASSRFPGKSLASLAGKPVVQHVYERARQCRYVHEVIIATDDERIAAAARKFGAPVRMTRSDHLSGTDRVAEITWNDTAEIVVNIQGDEPLIDPHSIDVAVMALASDDECSMATLKKRIEDPADIDNPNVVKVVTDRHDRAIYFSRLPLPYCRETQSTQLVRFKHIGLYVYRRPFLLAYPDLEVGPLESAERLEQLRALENGFSIRVVETEYESLGVDTPGDLQRLEHLFSSTTLIHG